MSDPVRVISSSSPRPRKLTSRVKLTTTKPMNVNVSSQADLEAILRANKNSSVPIHINIINIGNTEVQNVLNANNNSINSGNTVSANNNNQNSGNTQNNVNNNLLNMSGNIIGNNNGVTNNVNSNNVNIGRPKPVTLAPSDDTELLAP